MSNKIASPGISSQGPGIRGKNNRFVVTSRKVGFVGIPSTERVCISDIFRAFSRSLSYPQFFAWAFDRHLSGPHIDMPDRQGMRRPSNLPILLIQRDRLNAEGRYGAG